MNIRTRIAPSPTGEYHIGHLRTLLYNYAFAKKNNGKFIMRIEDTDQGRFVPGAADKILDVVKKYGLDWDEGPFYQSQRLDIYKKHALELIEKGHAYYCFCNKERLEKIRQEQKDKGLPSTKYDRYCLSLSKDEIDQNLKENKSYVIRLKVPENEVLSWDDFVLGKVSVNSSELDDQVLLKSDGFPTYHLAVVVDDHLMEISHIMRGTDWVPSTPKHILLYRFLGWEMPPTGHLPNLKEIGSNKKLSKRFGSTAAAEFLQEGYLPQAVVNFVMFIGWNPGTTKEIYTLDEFIEDFDIQKIHITDLVAIDREKLLWYNGYYIRNTPTTDLLTYIKKWANDFNVDLGTISFDDVYVLKVLELVKERLKVLKEWSELTGYFFKDPVVDKNLLISQSGSEEKSKAILEGFVTLLRNVNDWNVETLDKLAHDFIAEKGYKPKEAFMTLRVAVTGATATPPIFETLALLGKDVVMCRLTSMV